MDKANNILENSKKNIKETQISDSIGIKEATVGKNRVFFFTNYSKTQQEDNKSRVDVSGGISYPFNTTAVKAYPAMSPYHESCVNARVRAYVGNGFSILNKKFEKKYKQWLNCVNDQNESLNDILSKIAYNFVEWGNAFVDVRRFGNDFSLYTTLTPSTFVIANKANTGVEKYVFYKSTGDNPQKVFFNVLRPNKVIKSGGNYLYHIKNSNTVYSSYYGYPDWMSAEKAIYGNYLINYANNKMIENNGRPDFILVTKGDFSSEEAKLFQQYMRENHYGMDNINKGMHIALDNESDVNILDLSKLDQMKFNDLEKMYRQQIIVAHGLTPDYLGISDAGRSLSGSSAVGALIHLNETHFKQMNVFFEQKINYLLWLMFGEDPEIQIKEIGVTDAKTDAVVAETYIQNGVIKPSYFTRKKFADAMPEEIPTDDEIQEKTRTNKQTNDDRAIDPNGETGK